MTGMLLLLMAAPLYDLFRIVKAATAAQKATETMVAAGNPMGAMGGMGQMGQMAQAGIAGTQAASSLQMDEAFQARTLLNLTLISAATVMAHFMRHLGINIGEVARLTQENEYLRGGAGAGKMGGRGAQGFESRSGITGGASAGGEGPGVLDAANELNTAYDNDAVAAMVSEPEPVVLREKVQVMQMQPGLGLKEE